MNFKNHLYIIFICIIVACVLIFYGNWLETALLVKGLNSSKLSFGSPIFSFFTALNLNVLVILFLVFLVFRSGVKLIVNRSKGVFGSKLNTKLITAFLFFSFLPTVILLYVSIKFMNTNFERWLPPNFIDISRESLNAENEYETKIYAILNTIKPIKKDFNLFDFVFDKKQNRYIYLSDFTKNKFDLISNIIQKHRNKKEIVIIHDFIDGRKIEIKYGDDFIFGIITPKILNKEWIQLKSQFPNTQNSVRILRISYYVLLVVISLLILFSASWLGFTIAREMTIPIQILADAAENVARGNYFVQIDDIVSDDEMGSLARSFRSMLTDLRLERDRVVEFSNALKNKAQELLKKSEYNELLLQNMNTAVISIDDQFIIESWNHSASDIFYLQQEHVLKKKIQDVFNLNILEQAIYPLIKNDLKFQNSTTWTGKINETDCQFQISIKFILMPENKNAYLLFINDLTELAKAHRLAAWREAAKRIAHEIKNPLTPIKLAAQRLEKKFSKNFLHDDKKIFLESIRIIVQSTDAIRFLIDEFVQFARMPQSCLMTGNILDPAYITFLSFIENEYDVPIIFKVIFNSKEYELNQYTKLDMIPSIICKFDKDQIVRMFTNLLSNAINASAQTKKPVQIIVDFKKSNASVLIKIIDEGTGMSVEAKRHVFEPYFSTKKTGMGLGLVIVKQIVEEHMGKITIYDNFPQGSIFLVEMPSAS